MIDLTCTATLRPDLLKMTFDSHVENLFGDKVKEMHLIINIDKVGHNGNCNNALVETFKIIESYPFADYSINVSETPHFGRAFYWCMNQINQDLFFHLEEDWRLSKRIDFEKMIELMQNEEKLVHLRLSAFTSTFLKLKNWNKFLIWNGRYFEVFPELKGSIGWCGHPSLNKTFFMKECLKYYDPERNPEKQIKGKKYNHPMNELFASCNFGSFHERNCDPAIEDIGRKWMVKHGWVKSGNKAFFTQWERVEK